MPIPLTTAPMEQTRIKALISLVPSFMLLKFIASFSKVEEGSEVKERHSPTERVADRAFLAGETERGSPHPPNDSTALATFPMPTEARRENFQDVVDAPAVVVQSVAIRGIVRSTIVAINRKALSTPMTMARLCKP